MHEIEGGGHTYKMGIGVAHTAHFSVYNVIRGSGGILPQENLHHMRVFMRQSESTIMATGV